MNGLKKTLSIMLCVAMIASGSFMAFAEGESNPQNVTVVEGENAGENVGGEEGGNEGNEGENVGENKEENKDEDKQQSEALLAATGALNNLPLFDSLTEDTDADALLAQVQAARKAYDALTEEEKLLVEEAKLNNLLDLEFFFENRPSNTPADAPVSEVVEALDLTEAAEAGTQEKPTEVSDAQGLKDAVEAGGYIKLNANITASIEIKNEVHLDLNGKTLTNEADKPTITVANGGSLTVEGSGTVDNVSHAKPAVLNQQGGTVVLSGGSYTRSKEDSKENSFYNLQNLGTMTINSGVSVTADGHYSSLVANGWYNGSQNTAKQEANLTITGGNFSGGLNTIKNDDWGVLEISGGNFSNTTQATVMNWNQATVSGGTFTSEADVFANGYISADSDKGELTITGGTFTAGEGNNVVMISQSATNGGKIDISNATMTGNLNLSKAADVTISGTTITGSIKTAAGANVAIKDNSTVTGEVTGAGKVTVSTDSTVGDGQTETHPFVTNGNKYATLAEAIAAVKEGGTITLTSNVDNAEGIAVDEGKNFTIDFGGHTYTVKTPGAGSPNTETNAFQLLKDSTITMKNGTIRISADNKQNGDKKPIMRIIQNYANLTLENMTFYAQNQAGGEDYPLSFNNGAVVFKGNTSIITSSDSNIAFDVCKFNDYPSATVTFDESYTGTINGKIVYDATDASTHKLTINGNGTFGKIEASSKGEEAAKDAIEVSGGRFTAPVNKDYLADGYHYQLYSNDRYYSYHPTLEDAKNAAKPEGGTITDLNNPTQKPVVVPPSPNAPEKPNSNSGSTGSSSTVQQMEEREKPDPADKKAMEEYNFWMQVKSKIRATAEGKTLRITVKEGIEYMPASVMQTLYECKVGITLYWDGVTIEIPVGKAQPKQALRVYWTKTKLMDLYNA